MSDIDLKSTSVIDKNILDFFLTYHDKLITRKFILEMFTSTEYDHWKDFREKVNYEFKDEESFSGVLVKDLPDPESYLGNIYNISNDENMWWIVGCQEYTDGILKFVTLRICEPFQYPVGLLHLNRSFILSKDIIKNYNGMPIETTFGRFLLNYLCLTLPIGELIPYVNEVWNIGKIEEEIATLVLENKITPQDCCKYSDNGFFLAHAGELCVPGFTRKSLTTDPEFEIKKAVLLEKYKGKMNDPASLSQYEDELKKIDRDYLEGDESLDFYKSINGSFDNHRKKMYLTFGLSEAFKNGQKEYNFVEASLADGWKAKDIPVISNEIRKASYGRGIETAKGGSKTKEIMKVFQNIKITEDDCGTTRGEKIVLKSYLIKQFINRYILESGVAILLTQNNYKQYIDKEVLIRTPMHCQATTNNGYCYRCCGETIRTLDVESLGLQAVTVGSAFMGIAMKTMHNASVDLLDVSDIENYFIQNNIGV